MDEFQAPVYEPGMIGKRIRLARTRKNLPLRVVGEKMNVSPQAVAQWEKGNPKFDLDKAHALANLLDVDFDWLMDRKGSDDEIITSGLSSEFGGRIPIIPKDHAVLFVIYNRSKSRDIIYKETVEPTRQIVGQGFAILVESEDDFPPAQKGDLLIFDNGLVPKDKDFVAAILVDDFVRTVFARCIMVDDPDNKGTKILSLVPFQGSYGEGLVNKHGGATPIGVLTEYRRLYDLSEGPHEFFKG